jgi:hypothetical protein
MISWISMVFVAFFLFAFMILLIWVFFLLFLVMFARSLSMLFIFSKNQLFVSLILCMVFSLFLTYFLYLFISWWEPRLNPQFGYFLNRDKHGYTGFSLVSRPLSIHTEVYSKDHRGVLFLSFWTTFIVVSTVPELVYIPSSSR